MLTHVFNFMKPYTLFVTQPQREPQTLVAVVCVQSAAASASKGRFRTILDTQVIMSAVSARSVKGCMERAMQASWLNGLGFRVKCRIKP